MRRREGGEEGRRRRGGYGEGPYTERRLSGHLAIAQLVGAITTDRVLGMGKAGAFLS